MVCAWQRTPCLFDRTVKTWESLWLPLLDEAAAHAGRGLRTKHPLGHYASAVILARTSWDAYLHEFIEWRDLNRDLKRLHFKEALPAIFKAIGRAPPRFEVESPWVELLLVNHLRNAIVHHDATPRDSGESPSRVYERLVSAEVIPPAAAGTTWESSVLCAPVARWSCAVVAQSILAIEAIPELRRRSFELVRDAVAKVIDSVHEARGSSRW
jgi:hypothetical protein